MHGQTKIKYLFIYLNTKEYNIAWYFLRVWNLVCHTEVENGLWLFVYRVLRRIYGPKLEEWIRFWRRLYHDETHYVTAIIKKQMDYIGWARSTHMGEESYTPGFGRETWRNEKSLRLRFRCEDNIKRDLKETKKEDGSEWTGLIWLRIATRRDVESTVICISIEWEQFL